MSKAIHAFLFDTAQHSVVSADKWLKERGFAPNAATGEVDNVLRAVQIDYDALEPGTITTGPELDAGVTPIYAATKFDAETVFARAGSVVPLNDTGLSSEFVCSTNDRDTYGDIVEQKGLSLTEFRRNPVILFNHDPDKIIGRASRVGFGEDGSLIGTFEFADRSHGMLGELGESVGRMIKAGFINGASIGFTAQEREPIRDRKREVTGIRFTKSILKEISVVAIPANPKALVAARNLNVSEQTIRTLVSPVGQSPRRHEVARRLSLRKRAYPRTG